MMLNPLGYDPAVVLAEHLEREELAPELIAAEVLQVTKNELFRVGKIVHPPGADCSVAPLSSFSVQELTTWCAQHPDVDSAVIGLALVKDFLTNPPTNLEQVTWDILCATNIVGRLHLTDTKVINLYTDRFMYDDMRPVFYQGAILYCAADSDVPEKFYCWDGAGAG
jgi:hypothetical protein